ncbi:MAG: histidine phosphatase family protein [Clostridiales Family XIII bacterium]|jgi:probable phosphoglycerate mutase|nr:histidine phosphatase family protein [Clostridiales Family XIII bacterium]
MNESVTKTPIDQNAKKPGTRIFLVRHGQPVQHSGKIFLGQADVPLSERGKGEAAAAGDELLRLGARPKRVYASDLARAKETADIIAQRLGGIPVLPGKLLREMAMGSWDGELIEEIREKFPAEYAKRGDDLKNYRTPGGENFYDLRGRVIREFHRILSEDFRAAGGDPGDLVIVAHLGVIDVLSEEIHADGGEGGAGRNCATGSVTMLETPEWLML